MITDIVKAEVFQGMPVRLIWKDGVPVIPLVDISDAIGYDRSNLNHLLKRNDAVFEGMKMVVVMTTISGPKEHVCLTRDGVIALLVKMDSQRIKEQEKKDRVVAFQRWAIETLGKVMDGKLQAPLTMSEKYASFSPLIEDEFAIAKIMVGVGIPEHLTKAIALARIERRTGMSMKEYQTALPPAESIKAYYTPTELGSQVGLSGKEVNRILERSGMQYRFGSQWEVTEDGKLYAVRTYAASANWSGFQLKWVSDVIKFLLPFARGSAQSCL